MSKYDSVAPAAIRKLLDPRAIANAASCADELLLIDARTAEVLQDIDAANPTGTLRDTALVLSTLRDAIDAEDKEGQVRLWGMLEHLLGETAAVQTGWQEIHKLLDTRAKLSRAELGWQEFLSKKVVIQQLDVFIRALISQARMLTDDRQRLSAYALAVFRLGEGVIGKGLMAELPDVIDVEPE